MDDLENSESISSFDQQRYLQHQLEVKINKKCPVNLDSFNLISVIGKGAYAKVTLVRKKDDGKFYAMKILKKSFIEKNDQKQRVYEERNVLGETSNQFVVKMKYAFQNEKKLFFVLEYCPGGELFQILSDKSYFTEEQTKFYAAQILLALKYLHSKNIVYRDLKPENILIDEQGYIKLTDFGLSKTGVVGKEAKSVCGTPEYLAPEVLQKQGHGKPVDFWTLGCIIYEMFTGQPPFQISRGDKREQLFQKIKFEKFQIHPKIGGKISSLLDGLLNKNPDQRLGSKLGADEIMQHPWFEDMDWNLLQQRKIKAPFIPSLNYESELKYFNSEFVKEPLYSPENDNSNTRLESIYSKFSYWDNQSKRQSPTNYHQSRENISPSDQNILNNQELTPKQADDQDTIIFMDSGNFDNLNLND